MNERLPISESNPIRARYYNYNHFTYPWHFHSQYEIIYVKESSGLYFVGDAIDQYSANTLLLLGSNLPHYMRSDPIYRNGDDSLRVKGSIIQFEKDFMFYSINHYPQFLHIKSLLQEANRGVRISSPISTEIKSLMEKIPKEEGFFQLTDLLLLLQEMSTADKSLITSPLYSETMPTYGNSRMEKVMSYINSNYTKALSLKDIASMAAMNPTAFCRYFKENTGKTFLQYVVEMRIGYACKLLLMREMDISQICLESGFDSISHFNRTFKKITHFTPSQYQQNILG